MPPSTPAPLAIITHTDCLKHDTGPGHPERIARLETIHALFRERYANTPILDAPLGTRAQAALVHPERYMDRLEAAHAQVLNGDTDMIPLDGDTLLMAGTLQAAYRGMGGACHGIDLIATGQYESVFCATRPPGHHAEYESPMGFCLLGNVVIAARHAQIEHGIRRIAIIDFDVHHGNGSEDLVKRLARPDILFISSHEYPLYPGTGPATPPSERQGLTLNVTLEAGTNGPDFRAIYEREVWPCVRDFAPDLIILSAGFDAHARDPLANIMLEADDFGWLAREARTLCPRVLSVLEGGYDLTGLKESVDAHLQGLAAPVPNR